jgi:hypothetical protein
MARSSNVRSRPVIVDEIGLAWQAEADRAWAEIRATSSSTSEASARWLTEGTPLPRATWRPPEGVVVARQIFGRFLYDREANVLHDVLGADDSCALDMIAAATFIHFGYELAAAIPDDAIYHDCVRRA